MPRCGRLRSFLREYQESPKLGKISFVLPFLVLIFEIILINHAITIQEYYIIIITLILLALSIVEISFVSIELHRKYQRSNFDRILTIRLDDFIMKSKYKNVKIIVEQFIEKYPEYEKKRSQIYRTTCQVMETHKEEKIEQEIETKLKPFIKKRKKKTVDQILDEFNDKHPEYKKHSQIIYEKICQLKTNK